MPENIRFLIQAYPKFSAILTGSRRLKRLREEYWSALYGLGTSIPVTALDTESARKVVTEPVRDQLAFSQEAIERVIEVTARHPYLMQCLCNRVFDYVVQTKSRSITASVVNDAALGLVRDNEHFASLWDYAALGPETGRHRRQPILPLRALSFKHGTHISFGTLEEQLAQEGVDVGDEAPDADLIYLRELELIEFSGEIGDGEYRCDHSADGGLDRTTTGCRRGGQPRPHRGRGRTCPTVDSPSWAPPCHPCLDGRPLRRR
ncbi:MAG: hypothetical protein MZU91_12975 [Desulfosudis oleivorans]|nr:hypothetical protein [Desulfosudis oleivorans]